MLLCIQSSEGSELCIRFGREIHSLHCTDVYLGIKLNGHEVQSVSSALMIWRNFRGFLLETGTIAFCLVMCLHGLGQKTTIEVIMSFKDLTSFTLPYVKRKVGCTYMCTYVFMYYLY